MSTADHVFPLKSAKEDPPFLVSHRRQFSDDDDRCEAGGIRLAWKQRGPGLRLDRGCRLDRGYG